MSNEIIKIILWCVSLHTRIIRHDNETKTILSSSMCYIMSIENDITIWLNANQVRAFRSSTIAVQEPPDATSAQNKCFRRVCRIPPTINRLTPARQAR